MSKLLLFTFLPSRVPSTTPPCPFFYLSDVPPPLTLSSFLLRSSTPHLSPRHPPPPSGPSVKPNTTLTSLWRDPPHSLPLCGSCFPWVSTGQRDKKNWETLRILVIPVEEPDLHVKIWLSTPIINLRKIIS